MNEQDCQAEIVEALRAGKGFPHAVDAVEMLETHISWVFLAGDFAYKMKKAIKLNFLDFTGLGRRHEMCDIELTLNRRWAPELYLDVLPVCGDCGSPQVGGEGEPIEYLVRMRRFPQSARLDRELESGRLTSEDMRELAVSVADLHTNARSVAFRSAQDTLRRVTKPITDNYPHVQRVASDNDLAKIMAWTERQLERVNDLLIARHRDGYVRECHGDLHLANLVRLDDRIAAFDCIEFEPELREIDVVSDVSFLVMDLAARGRFDLAYIFLNRYLELSGDYAGMRLLDLYVVYHCMIRAKVASIRYSERGDDPDRALDVAEVGQYMRLALDWVDRPAARLVAMHGYSGSGKSHLSAELMHSLPALRIRTDTERKRALGLDELAPSGSKVGEGAYTTEARAAVYDRILDTAAELLDAGHTVILDASMLRREFRERVAGLAARTGVAWYIVSTTAPEDELIRRLDRRAAGAGDVSEADRAVLLDQFATADPFDAAERARLIEVPTTSPVDVDALVARLRDADG